MKNKYIALILCFIFLIFVPVSVAGDDILPPDEYEIDYSIEVTKADIDNPVMNARSAVLVEADSMRILFEKNPYVKRANASTTKILTAIAAIEAGGLDEIVTVSKKAAAIGGSTIHLKAGEKIKLIDLLYGLMLKSGNDAAIAIAEHVGGTVENFMKICNDKAAEIGAMNTHFTSPHGLDNADHYTTAYDLALIASYCMKNDVFRQIVSTTDNYIPDRALRNTNDLLFTYNGATGIKTGFTNGAGRCLVAAAKRDGMEVIAVVLGCDNKTARFKDSRVLLDYAFKNYKKVRLVSNGDVIRQIKVRKGITSFVDAVAAETIELPLTEAEKQKLEQKIMLPDFTDAPVDKGIITGNLYFVCGEATLGETDILFKDPVEKKNVGDFFNDILKEWCAML